MPPSRAALLAIFSMRAPCLAALSSQSPCPQWLVCSMPVVSIHQPAYLPWLGYFDRIAASDVFVFLDTVQFEKNSFTNRNRIKTPNGPLWLTIPVRQKGHFSKSLREIEIENRQDWKRKHLRSIVQYYRDAPQFAEKFRRLVSSYGSDATHLADFCYRQLGFWLSELEIPTRVVRASELAVSGSKSDLVLALCKELGATTYLSGPLGRDYLQPDQFSAAGIEIRYQDFKHPEYPQPFGTFLPALAVVDYWMNCANLHLSGTGR
jgi:hypothetical protein